MDTKSKEQRGMPKLNSEEINAAKLKCATRDGLRCNNPECHKKPGETYLDSHNQEKKTYLELDHVDGNPENNPPDGSNWQLLCVPCNRLKSAPDRKRKPKFRSFEQLKKCKLERVRKYGKMNTESLLVQYASMQKNLVAEPIVTVFIDRTVEDLGSVDRSVLINAAAQEVSLQTKGKSSIGQGAVRGYLDRRCNPINGTLEYFEHPKQSGHWMVRKRKEEK
jgi:hypothetical protein